MTRYAEPVCPQCGSGYIKEWGAVEAASRLDSIEIRDDNTAGEVSADEPLDTSWDSWTFSSYSCGSCGYDTRDANDFIKAAIETPYSVTDLSTDETIERFAQLGQAEEFIAALPASLQDRYQINSPTEIND